MKLRKLVSLLLSAITVFSLFTLTACDDTAITFKKYRINNDAEFLFDINTAAYSYYIGNNSEVPIAYEDAVFTCDGITNAASFEYEIEQDGKKYALIDENSKWVEWKFNATEELRYIIFVDYKTLTGDNSDMILSLSLDGKYPYEELENLSLSRMFEDTCGDKFDTDKSGNDIKSPKQEILTDLSSGFNDEKGYSSDYYQLIVPAGEHTLRLSSVRGAVLIEKLYLKAPQELISYENYLTFNAASEKANKRLVIEAEHPKYTNDASIYAVSDWQDPSTSPNNYYSVKLNAIGDTNWSKVGKEIAWELNVPQSGFYQISVRARQDYSEGMNAYRALKIDGEIPFKEASSIAFPYDFDWKTTTCGGDKPYYFYLEKGKHTLSLSVSPGDMSQVLENLDGVVADLNAIYRKIIVVTGTTVDIYQDYDLENRIPELIDSFKDVRNRIYAISEDIKAINNSSGSRASILEETVVMIDKFVAHPYEISGGLSNYKIKIEDIATLLTNMSSQALLVDKIILTPKGQKVDEGNVSFWDSMLFSLGKYIESFNEDNSDNNASHKTINVWVSTGRDQAQIIKSMISNDFTEKHKIDVNLNIVDTGTTLIQAALANKGPDLAINIAHNEPVNLAMRGGLVDLKKYITDDVYNEFFESAWTPFLYGDGIYGVPETQTFDMLFIRNDIFKNLGIEKAPDTWDDFYKCMEKIQNNKLMVGVAETNSATIAVSGGISTFQKFYFQKGYTYYNDNYSATTFDSEEAIECMTRVCELYTKYGLDRQFDFLNRFRSGELAMGINSYATYNLITASAPEIAGLWSMYPIPGTKDKNGKINRAQSSGGTASIILKAATEHNVEKESWEFIKWWTSAGTQTDYAARLEGTMGVAARYTPANIEAFKSIKWTPAESEALLAQWNEVYNVREIPGNYYIQRSLTSAIRNTISKGTSIRFNLAKYNKDIISEITRKRKEFNIK